MIFSNNTIQVESLSDFFKNVGEKGFIVSKKMAKNVIKNPTRALDITANIARVAASRNPENVISILLITIYNTGKGLYMSKFV